MGGEKGKKGDGRGGKEGKIDYNLEEEGILWEIQEGVGGNREGEKALGEDATPNMQMEQNEREERRDEENLVGAQIKKKEASRSEKGEGGKEREKEEVGETDLKSVTKEKEEEKKKKRGKQQVRD